MMRFIPGLSKEGSTNNKHTLPKTWDIPPPGLKHGSHGGETSMGHSATGTRTRVARVRAEYPNQLDYSGSAVHVLPLFAFVARLVRNCIAITISVAPRC